MARTSRKQRLAKKAVAVCEKPRYSAALYVRISVESARKREMDTAGTQIQLLRDFVAGRSDIEVFDVYNDDDISGTNYDRPEFSRMMNDIRDQKINCVIVKDLSRLGRNALETGEYIEMVFPFFHVRFVAVNDGFDSLVQQADLGVQLKNFVNERYARDISQKIVSAKRVLQKQGKYDGGRPPYGYMIDPNDKHHLVIDEETAPTVYAIFKMIDEGVSVRKVAITLNERGVPSPGRVLYERGIVKRDNFATSNWYSPTIKNILKNQVYLGWSVHGKQRSFYSSGGEKDLQTMPKEEWHVVKEAHEPIVTEELFFRIGDKLEQARANASINDVGDKGRRNPLRGKLHCGECGKSMALRQKKNGSGVIEAWYFCPVHEHYNSRYCPKKAVKRNILDGVTLRILTTQMRLIIERSALIRRMNTAARGKAHYRGYMRAIERTKADIDVCLQRKAELYADYSAGVLTKEEYLSYGQEYAKRADELRILLADQEHDAKKYAPDYSIDGKWGALIEQYMNASCLDEQMVDAFVDTLTIYNDGHVELRVKFSDLWAEVESIWEVRKGEVEYLQPGQNDSILSETVG